MNKKIQALLLVGAIIIGCNTSSDKKEQINYGELEILETDLVLEISESEEFLPGQLYDVVVDSDENILVSDWGNNSISQFDPEGNFVAQIAEGGNGPGELSDYFGIKNVGHDTLMVQNYNSGREYFAKDSDGKYQFVRSNNPDRSPMMGKETLGHKTDSTYYTTFTPRYGNMQQAVQNEEEYRNSILAETSLSGQIMQDSLLLLKKGTRHILQTGGGYAMLQIPYRFDDHLALLDDGFLVARPDSNAIYIYDDKIQLKKRIPLNVEPRPISEEDLDVALGYVPDNVSGNQIRDLKSRIGETKPPYVDLWASDQIIWLQITNNRKKDTKMVLLDYNGEPLGKIMLPNTKDIGAVRENYIYTIHEDPERGDTIRKYEVKL